MKSKYITEYNYYVKYIISYLMTFTAGQIGIICLLALIEISTLLNVQHKLTQIYPSLFFRNGGEIFPMINIDGKDKFKINVSSDSQYYCDNIWECVNTQCNVYKETDIWLAVNYRGSTSNNETLCEQNYTTYVDNVPGYDSINILLIIGYMCMILLIMIYISVMKNTFILNSYRFKIFVTAIILHMPVCIAIIIWYTTTNPYISYSTIPHSQHIDFIQTCVMFGSVIIINVLLIGFIN